MKKDKKITIRVSEEEYQRIEKVAKKLNLPTSRLIRNLTLTGLEDAELFAKLGFFDAIKLITKLREKAFVAKNLKLANQQ